MTDLVVVPQPGDPHARPDNHHQQGDTVTYTHADVELVARALHDHPGDTPFDYYDDAKRALDALAAAGRLNTAVAHQWSVRYPEGNVGTRSFTEAGARQWADVSGCVVVYREVGPWIEAPS